MTSLASLVDPTLVARVGWTLVHSIWQGALIAAITAVLCYALRGARPQLRYLLACVSLCVMVATAVVTFSVIRPAHRAGLSASATSARADRASTQWTLLDTQAGLGTRPGYAVPINVTTIPATPGTSTAASAARAGEGVGNSERTSSSGNADGVTAAAARTGTELNANRTSGAEARGNALAGSIFEPGAWQRAALMIERLLPQFVALWIVGLMICSIRLLGALALVEHLKRHQAHPMPPEWQARVAALARRMRVRGTITVRASVEARTAAVIGWLRPVILVPAAALAGLTSQQLEAVIAHELAHVRRHDYLVNLLQSLAETLFFYHPAVWYLSRCIRTEREHCCDDEAVAVVGDAVTYAGALTDLEMLRQGTPALAMAANGGSLLRRIQRLLGPSTDTAPSWSTATSLLAIAVACFALASARGSIAASLQPASTPAATASSSDGRLTGTPTTRPSARSTSPLTSQMTSRLTSPGESATTPGAAADADDQRVPPAPPVPPAAPGTPVMPPAPPAAPAHAWPGDMPTPPDPPEPAEPLEPIDTPVPPAPAAPAAPRAVPAPPAPAAAPTPYAAPAPRAPHAAPAPYAPAAPPAPYAVPAPPAAPTPHAAPAPYAPPALPAPVPTPPAAAQAPAAPTPSTPPPPPPPPPQPGGIQRAMNWIESWFENEKGTNNWTWQENGHRFSVKSRGTFEFTDDDLDIKSVSEGGYLVLEERLNGVSTRIEVRHKPEGGLHRAFFRNGQAVAYEPEGRAWLTKKVPDLIRRSGFGADGRVRRILAQQGASGVLDEVTRIPSAFVKRLYMEKLLAQTRLEGQVLTRLLTQAGKEITSDYERATLLIKVAKSGQIATDEQRLAYAVASQTINSGYEHRRALEPFVQTGPLSEQVLKAVLDSASRIESDYELASLLIPIGKQQPLTPGSMDVYVVAAKTIDSDYELRRALTPLIAQPAAVPAGVLSAVFRATAGIDSDYELASLLIDLVNRQKLDDSHRLPFFQAVDTIQSDYERGRVLKALVSRGAIGNELALGTIESTHRMNSSYEAGNVLKAVASSQPLDATLRKAYITAAERLTSDHERDGALVMLVRNEARTR